MPLNKAAIKGEVKSAFTQVMDQQGDDREGAIDKVADKIADAIVNAMKSTKITNTAQIISMIGAVTGTFNYTIS